MEARRASFLASVLVLALSASATRHLAQESDDSTSMYLTDGDIRSGVVEENGFREFRFLVDGVRFVSEPFDLLVTLDVLSGDADLVLKGPNRLMVYSEHPTGADILYLSRDRILSACVGLQECELRIIVVGYTPMAEYELLFDIEHDLRNIHPDDQQALESIFATCCQALGSCDKLARAMSRSGISNQQNFCYLEGQICDVNGRVMHLDLSGSKMSCEFPSKIIVRMKGLERLFLYDNAITGQFQQVLDLAKDMPHLKHIHMSSNKLGGSIACCPEGSSNNCLQHIKTIDVKNNQVFGSLPRCLLELPEIGFLDFQNNTLTGGIPANLQPSSSLIALDVRNQRGDGMSGTLPDFRPLSTLALLGLSGNQFEGSFPAVPSTLEALHLARNRLSGPVHDSVAHLDKVWILDFSRNQLTGSIPAAVAQYSHLKLFNASSNFLSGPIPNDWNAKNLKLLDLSSNQLDGPLPSSLATMPRLVHLNVSSNRLTGELRPFADKLGFNDMLQFIASRNFLTGPIPENMKRMAMFMSFNAYGGTITSIFDVAYNRLDGDFPESLVDMIVRRTTSSAMFDIQGNTIRCPSSQTEAQIRQRLTQLAASTCMDKQLRTIAGDVVPQEVKDEMDRERKRESTKPQAPKPQPGPGLAPVPSPASYPASASSSAAAPSQSGSSKGIWAGVIVGVLLASGSAVGYWLWRKRTSKRPGQWMLDKANDYDHYTPAGDADADLDFSSTNAPLMKGKFTMDLSGTPNKGTPIRAGAHPIDGTSGHYEGP